MKRLIIGDVHLNEVYGDYFHRILFPFLEHVHENKDYDSVMFVGDIFDTSTINNGTAKLFKKLLSIYDEMDIIILNGNHDKITKSDSIFDILMLPENVKVYKDVTFDRNNIYLPHIHKSVDHHEIFDNITRYIKTNNLSDVYIYSHNDFGEIYKFKNNFFNISTTFQDTNANVYLINGHNHVPFFKKYNNLYILNIGCAINTSFNDTALFNYFIVVDDTEEFIEGKFDLFMNSKSVQYLTCHVYNESHIYEHCNKINKSNHTFIKFIIHDPTIVIDNNFKNELQSKFNIVDILTDYDIENIVDISTVNPEDNTSLTELCVKLNIKIEDLMSKKTTESSDKVEILFSLLNLMFESRQTSNTDIDRVISTIKKYML